MDDLHVWLDPLGDEVRREPSSLVRGPLAAALDARAWARLVRAVGRGEPVTGLDLTLHDGRILDASIAVEHDRTCHVVLRDVTRYAGPMREFALTAQALNDRNHDLSAIESLASALASVGHAAGVARVTAASVAAYLDADVVVVRFDGIPGGAAAGVGVMPPTEPAGQVPMDTPHLRLGTVRWWGGLVVTEERRRVATLMASRAAIAAETALLFDAARAESRVDHLTGVLNRGGGQQGMRALSSPCVVALLDLDKFKEINDRHGHAAGDRALRDVSALLDGGSRPGDLVIRWGGDEFVLVWPRVRDSDMVGARERLERLVEQCQIAVRIDGVGITFSAGLTDLRDDGWEAALDRADRALYAAKTGGRARVRVAPDEAP